MFSIETVAEVTYTCTISDETEEKIKKYIRERPDDFRYCSYEEAIIKAVIEFYYNAIDDIDIYENSTESDFMTSEVRWSQFEDRSAEEILGDTVEVL